MISKTLRLLLGTQFLFFSSLFSQTAEQLRANLYAVNATGAFDLYDGNLTMYDVENSNAIDRYDAVKMSNFGENFGLQRGTNTLVIERRAPIVTVDTTFFRMWNMRNTTYKIALWATGLNHPGLTGILEDAYLDTKTALDLNGANDYTFTITNVPESSSPDRFRIVFSSLQAASSTLPITFNGIKTYKKQNQVNVDWIVDNQKDIVKYDIQKSVSGRPFFTTATVMAKPGRRAAYPGTDLSSLTSDDEYRKSSTDTHGAVRYSIPTQISNDQSVSIYPNPVANGIINFQLNSVPKGVYVARVINFAGQVLQSSKLTHDGGKSVQKIYVNKNTVKGNYFLEIITPGNSKMGSTLFLR